MHVVSSGKAEQLALQKQLYRAQNESDIQTQFRTAFEKIQNAKVVVLGCPSDVGAGLLRGANVAPQAIRLALLQSHQYWAE